MSLWISIYLPPSCFNLQRSLKQHEATPVASIHSCSLLKPLALAMLQYTPEVAYLNTAVVLKVEASVRLFKGPQTLVHNIQKTVASLGLKGRIGMAPTALGAYLLARSSRPEQQRQVLCLTELSQLLETLPVRYLEAAQAYLPWLASIGCERIGQLAALPRASLIQRTSPDLGAALDAAYGKKPMLFNWYQAPDTFRLQYVLDFPLSHTHALLAVAKHLVESLCGWLHARQWASDKLDFYLHHETGRYARPASLLSLRLSVPAWKPDDFLTVLAEQLHCYALPAAVISISLGPVIGQTRQATSHTLFPDPRGYFEQESQLIDLLCARLGRYQVLKPYHRASYLPEQANQWHPALEALDVQKIQATPCWTKSARPFWLLDRPLLLATRQDRPMYHRRPLQLISGPERLESGWWCLGRQEQRDYFIARDKEQHRYWIYRLRGTQQPQWFLHGLFA